MYTNKKTRSSSISKTYKKYFFYAFGSIIFGIYTAGVIYATTLYLLPRPISVNEVTEGEVLNGKCECKTSTSKKSPPPQRNNGCGIGQSRWDGDGQCHSIIWIRRQENLSN